ncbi:DNA repair protein RecN [Rickettsiales endosymbiont of Stachyamoeba lipophora]|uniref:DNA repair protein RecN n=1 Tax=Rickettsiales endosymbiont of Stachyamoeba lipophora TaxID=2486578 RepID=UPI000F649312|nr:DNA repair protein RecN [Rickettsiales endosymbiont of Stachyamoeba lipophora]AZL14970.1 DNA repair protein RecN [Rickettsiales endosymbiont of Stachyamoeba lipophora]
MLKSIAISNFIIINQLSLKFYKGLTIITGETGSGKSLLFDALSFVLNLSNQTNLLTTGEQKGYIVAEFDASLNQELKQIFAEYDLGSNNNIIIRRTFSNENKTKAFINDIPVTQSLLKKIGQELIEISAQFEAMKLFKPKFYLNSIDDFGKNYSLRGQVSEEFLTLQQLKNELEELILAQEKQLAEQDYLEFVLKELEELKPIHGEEDRLVEQKSLLNKKVKLQEFVHNVIEHIDGNNGINSQINSLQKYIIRNSNQFDELNIGSISDDLDLALTQINLVHEKCGQLVDRDYGDLEEIETRLMNLKAAARKYRVTVEELSTYQEQVAEKINNLNTLDAKIKEQETLVTLQHEKYLKLAQELSQKRLAQAKILSSSLNDQLRSLNMVQVDIKIEHQETPISQNGIDYFEFLLKTNEASGYGKLSQIASGGELSRIILAIKIILADSDIPKLLIFDEIDTGVSGSTASKIGKKLKELAKIHQIILITHQPQIAAFSHHHLLVSKSKQGLSHIDYLDPTTHLTEVARLLSGEKITAEAMTAAEKLIEEGQLP